MLLPIDLHPNAIKDLDSLRAEDPCNWGRIVALLQELKNNKPLQERMLTHRGLEELSNCRVEFQHWVEAWERGSELWRIKIYEPDADVQLLPYRIIYAFHPWEQHDRRAYFLILAIAPRSFGYDTNSTLAERIRRDFVDHCPEL